MVSVILSAVWLLISTVSSYLVFINTRAEMTALGVFVAFLVTSLMIFILKEAEHETNEQNTNTSNIEKV